MEKEELEIQIDNFNLSNEAVVKEAMEFENLAK